MTFHPSKAAGFYFPMYDRISTISPRKLLNKQKLVGSPCSASNTHTQRAASFVLQLPLISPMLVTVTNQSHLLSFKNSKTTKDS